MVFKNKQCYRFHKLLNFDIGALEEKVCSPNQMVQVNMSLRLVFLNLQTCCGQCVAADFSQRFRIRSHRAPEQLYAMAVILGMGNPLLDISAEVTQERETSAGHLFFLRPRRMLYISCKVLISYGSCHLLDISCHLLDMLPGQTPLGNTDPCDIAWQIQVSPPSNTGAWGLLRGSRVGSRLFFFLKRGWRSSRPMSKMELGSAHLLNWHCDTTLIRLSSIFTLRLYDVTSIYIYICTDTSSLSFYMFQSDIHICPNRPHGLRRPAPRPCGALPGDL